MGSCVLFRVVLFCLSVNDMDDAVDANKVSFIQMIRFSPYWTNASYIGSQELSSKNLTTFSIFSSSSSSSSFSSFVKFVFCFFLFWRRRRKLVAILNEAKWRCDAEQWRLICIAASSFAYQANLQANSSNYATNQYSSSIAIKNHHWLLIWEPWLWHMQMRCKLTVC